MNKQNTGFFTVLFQRYSPFKNLAVWLSVFWPIPQEPDFPQVWVFARIQQIRLIFFTDQIQKKWLHFPLNSKEKLFFGLFSPFSGQFFSPKRSGSITHNTTWASNTILSFRKNLWVNLKKTSWQKDGKMNGWTYPNSQDPSITGGRGAPKTVYLKSSRRKPY